MRAPIARGPGAERPRFKSAAPVLGVGKFFARTVLVFWLRKLFGLRFKIVTGSDARAGNRFPSCRSGPQVVRRARGESAGA